MSNKLPEALVRLVVVDQDGHPVDGARLSGGFVTGDWVRDYSKFEGRTDGKGECAAKGLCSAFLRVLINKDGYYPSDVRIDFRSTSTKPSVVDGKWQPYGATRTVVLKRIKEPGKTIGFDDGRTRHAIPVWGQWIGFDLELGDWLPPYGKGRCEDVLLRFKSEMRKRPFDYTRSMEVSFTNNPFAGAYFMKKDETSILKSEYAARTNAAYLATLDFLQDSRPDKPMASKVLERDSYLVFRTRTRLDEKGRLVGAHYGKIYYWMWGEKDMSLSGGCFNPVENDPSIEGDTVLRREILRGHK